MKDIDVLESVLDLIIKEKEGIYCLELKDKIIGAIRSDILKTFGSILNEFVEDNKYNIYTDLTYFNLKIIVDTKQFYKEYNLKIKVPDSDFFEIYQ